MRLVCAKAVLAVHCATILLEVPKQKTRTCKNCMQNWLLALYEHFIHVYHPTNVFVSEFQGTNKKFHAKEVVLHLKGVGS